MTEHIDPTTTDNHYVRRSQRPRSSMRDKLTADSGALWIAGALAGLVVLALLVVGIDAALMAGRVHYGVSVAGVKVGGQTPDQAAATLKQELEPRLGQVVVLESSKKTWQVDPTSLKATFDYDALVEDAMDVGRTDNALGQRFSAWFGGVEVPASATLDSSQFGKLYGQISKTLAVPATDAKVVIDGRDVSVSTSADGTQIVKADLRKGVETAIGALPEQRTIDIPFAVLKPTVTEDALQQAADDASQMLSAPVTVTYKEKSWEFSPEDIGEWIVFTSATDTSTPDAQVTGASNDAASGSDPVIRAVLSADETSKAIAPKVRSIGRKPVDAKFHTSGGKVTISPSQDGLQADMAALTRSLQGALERDGEGRQAPLRMTVLEPKLTSEKAKSMGIRTRISSYTTEYDSGNRPRVNNIHTLADSLDGALIPPGGTFSFNGQVGERTAEKGYQEANAIVNGKLVPQLGGGICQVGTTIFNAVFESGLPVIERSNHSFYISHYPTGRDATVSWGGPDFKFKNDTQNWVLVAAGYTDSEVTISLYGTDPGYDVSSKTGDFYNVKPYPTETVKDPTMPKGAKLVTDSGVEGKSVKVTRTVTKNGKVIRTDTFTSNYRPKVEVVKVGTKVAKPKTTAAPSTTTKKP